MIIVVERCRLQLAARHHRRLAVLTGHLCALYNAALEERISAYRHGVTITKYDQMKSLTQIRKDDPAFSAYYVEVLRSPLRRLDEAYAGFFRRIKAGADTPGFPRFRARRRYASFSLFAAPLRDNAIYLKGIGWLRFKRHRPLPGPIKQIRFVRGVADAWSVHFICEVATDEAVEPATTAFHPVGVDVGLTDLVTTSDGKRFPNRKFTRKHEHRLAVAQRALARCKRRSQNRRRALKDVRRVQRRIADARGTALHRISRHLVNTYSHIAIEQPAMVGELIVKASTDQEVSNKSIHDAAWGILFRQLAYKAAWAGKQVRGVEPRGTSQNCSGCGIAVPKSLRVRWHRCACGVSLHRDVNAARNILARAQFAEDNDDEDVVALGLVSNGQHEPQLQLN